MTSKPASAEDPTIKLSSSLQVFDIPVDRCLPLKRNANEQDDETFNTLTEEIDESNEDSPGFIEPIQVVPIDDGFYQIVGGEHRWRACKALGRKTIPCILLTDDKWKSEEFREFVAVRLNVLKGKLNGKKFMELYNSYVEKHGAEKLQRLFAVVDEGQWLKLTGGTRQQLKKGGASKEMLAEFDMKSRQAKTIDDLSAILNGIFNKYGNDLKMNFLVFTYGNKEHLYIRMSDKMAKSMEKVKVWCRENKVDINACLEPIVLRFQEVVENPALFGVLQGTGSADDWDGDQPLPTDSKGIRWDQISGDEDAEQ